MELVFIIAIIILVSGCFFFYERKQNLLRELPLVAVLSALAAIGRMVFVFVPGVQMTSFFVIVTALVFGPLAGAVVGILAAAVSNIFLGQGIWTLWQMAGWGLCGLVSGFFGKQLLKSRRLLLFWGFVFGLLYGWFNNIWYWLAFLKVKTLTSFFALSTTTLFFDLLHATANVAFLLVLAPWLIKELKTYKIDNSS